MKQAPHIILGVHIHDRVKKAGAAQKLFTEYGCHIKTRIGLHEVSEDVCARNGIILLEMIGGAKKAEKLVRKLGKIKGIDVQKMVFGHA